MNQETRKLIQSTDKVMKGVLAFTVAASIGATSLITYNLNPAEVEAKEVVEIEYLPTKQISLETKELKLKVEKPQTQISSVVVEVKPTFQFISTDLTTYDLTNPSHLTASQIDQIIAGTELEGLGWAYAEAEAKHGVNALYLLAHSALESGWGSSPISQSKNNLFGFQAYDASPGKSAKSFNTKGDCILIVANYIAREYLQKDGDHYNGPTLNGMGMKYASDKEWSVKIAQIMNGIQKKIEKV